MAVFTHVSTPDLERFLAAYDLGEVRQFLPITEGIENTNYRLETTTGRHVLTLFERRTPEDALPFVIALLEHLADKSAPVPRPIPDREGRCLSRLCGRPALIVSFLDGRAVDRPDVTHCRAAGVALARLHVAAADFAARRANPFGIAGWRPLLEACREVAHDRRDLLLCDRVAAALAMLPEDWPPSLPRGTCHADLFPDNVFFDGDRVSGIIDFYFAATDALAYDLAIALAAWGFDAENRWDRRRAAAMIEGYEEIRPLASAERDRLPVLCLGAAVRFTLTRLYDRLHPREEALVREKDPGEFAARMDIFAALAGNNRDLF
ncbi:MAG: homoserine kinase [Alphaproteobacteria bacterium]|nr:MAG: homoserine kinase [Alphaproteobacteria bacterium]